MNAAPTEWTILHVGHDTNAWWKVIARRGEQVLHRGTLTEQQARDFTPADAALAWASR